MERLETLVLGRPLSNALTLRQYYALARGTRVAGLDGKGTLPRPAPGLSSSCSSSPPAPSFTPSVSAPPAAMAAQAPPPPVLEARYAKVRVDPGTCDKMQQLKISVVVQEPESSGLSSRAQDVDLDYVMHAVLENLPPEIARRCDAHRAEDLVAAWKKNRDGAARTLLKRVPKTPMAWIHPHATSVLDAQEASEPGLGALKYLFEFALHQGYFLNLRYLLAGNHPRAHTYALWDFYTKVEQRVLAAAAQRRAPPAQQPATGSAPQPQATGADVASRGLVVDGGQVSVTRPQVMTRRGAPAMGGGSSGGGLVDFRPSGVGLLCGNDAEGPLRNEDASAMKFTVNGTDRRTQTQERPANLDADLTSLQTALKSEFGMRNENDLPAGDDAAGNIARERRRQRRTDAPADLNLQVNTVNEAEYTAYQ